MHEKWLNKNDLLLDSYSKYDIKPQFNGGLKDPTKSCFLSSKNPSINDYDYSYCTNTEKHKKTILLFGDSHVAEFSKAIREKYWNYNIIQATSSGCPPIINVKGEGTCQTLFNMVFNKIIKDKQIDIAIVGANWSAFATTNDIITGISQTNQLLKERIATVKFISQTKNYPSSLPMLIMNSKNISEIVPAEDSHIFYNKMKKELPTINFIDIYNYGCKNGKCKLLNDDNIPMFFDNNHYTYEWTKNIVNDLF
ncbi:SGNH hydrolase domain-containing protein [Buttiauxella selenatireducens]|uniref:SGNH hydrolase domain-containing protein n=1 Tax=Buttiauxella selenatireducens TaxID=3073902 RepID=A0ABY9S6J7_9ENTR|nr:SGNH hydrolase domain-containing protein [Buttiauxella sp. R73]WMY73120.1 SGNH hydrolase domain-containing protein [Buttiauxella sp. R73]